MINIKNIADEYLEGRYFSDETAVNVDYQNGKINVVAYCICKETAKDMARGLNLSDNLIEDGIEILDQIFFEELPYLFGIGDEKDIFYQRRTGRYEKGDRKIKKKIYDLIPVLRGLERSKTPEEAQKWFNSVR